jgi:hypothetical protein
MSRRVGSIRSKALLARSNIGLSSSESGIDQAASLVEVRCSSCLSLFDVGLAFFDGGLLLSMSLLGSLINLKCKKVRECRGENVSTSDLTLDWKSSWVSAVVLLAVF